MARSFYDIFCLRILKSTSVENTSIRLKVLYQFIGIGLTLFVKLQLLKKMHLVSNKIFFPLFLMILQSEISLAKLRVFEGIDIAIAYIMTIILSLIKVQTFFLSSTVPLLTSI